ncbi:hypothetical protein HMPREF0663_11699 [Hoylesella oralis ATCC 33269]|uniref:Uncharacterized protein n=1 Tax=Hoylesella oralis ATCC 33269 TaxID=873533 RepID=E7RR98_9BACT|nr:hypothetical protein HMPREF0663_11699 [Hoylesella oralis ATCC 33269]
MAGFLQYFLTDCAHKTANVQKNEMQIEKIFVVNIFIVRFKLFRRSAI